MRSAIIIAMLLFPSIGLLLSVYFGYELKRYMKEVAEICSQQDFDRFKHIAKKQMYAALVQMVVLMTPIVLFLYGKFTNVLDYSDVVFLIVPSLVMIIVGLCGKKTEKLFQSLPVADELRQEHDRVVHVWIHKAFPDW